MPFTTHRSQRIHFTRDGAGPAIILQHGQFSHAAAWHDSGHVAALAAQYTVICVDALGHGRSDAPADPVLYTAEQRVGDIVAVLEELGAPRAHVVGYSMGGWIAAHMARHAARRLASLTIGGWDVTNGLAATGMPAGEPGFHAVLTAVRTRLGALADWITDAHVPALQASWQALEASPAGAEALQLPPCPVLLWAGRADPVHDAMQAFARTNGHALLSTEGDHATARTLHAAESVAGLRAFIYAAA